MHEVGEVDGVTPQQGDDHGQGRPAGPATMATVTSFWVRMDDGWRLAVRAGGVAGSQRPGPDE